MLDFVLGALFVALAVRGWLRGLVREVIGLGVVIVGLFLAFRLSTPLGQVVESMVGTSTDVSRLIAGIFLVVVISVGAGIVAHVLHAGLRMVPGLTTLNRAAGVLFSTLAGVVVLTVATSVLAVLPIAEPVDDAVSASVIAGFLTDPDGLPQKTIGVVAGDRVMATVIALEELVGERRVVAPERRRLPLPGADPDDLKVATKAANRAFNLLNRERAGADAAPLVRSERLDALALAYAMEVAETGRLSEVSGDGSTVNERLAAAGVRVAAAEQVVVLAPSVRSGHEALTLKEAAREEMVDRNLRRVGVAAVKVPLGMLLVEILTS